MPPGPLGTAAPTEWMNGCCVYCRGDPVWPPAKPSPLRGEAYKTPPNKPSPPRGEGGIAVGDDGWGDVLDMCHGPMRPTPPVRGRWPEARGGRDHRALRNRENAPNRAEKTRHTRGAIWGKKEHLI